MFEIKIVGVILIIIGCVFMQDVLNIEVVRCDLVNDVCCGKCFEDIFVLFINEVIEIEIDEDVDI